MIVARDIGTGGEPLELRLPPMQSLVWRVTFPFGPLGIGLVVRLREPFGMAMSVTRRRAPADRALANGAEARDPTP